MKDLEDKYATNTAEADSILGSLGTSSGSSKGKGSSSRPSTQSSSSNDADVLIKDDGSLESAKHNLEVINRQLKEVNVNDKKRLATLKEQAKYYANEVKVREEAISYAEEEKKYQDGSLADLEAKKSEFENQKKTQNLTELQVAVINYLISQYDKIIQ